MISPPTASVASAGEAAVVARPTSPATSGDTRLWRIGTHYGIHIYAVNPLGDSPIATAMTAAAAAQIVAEHNAFCGDTSACEVPL